MRTSKPTRTVARSAAVRRATRAVAVPRGSLDARGERANGRAPRANGRASGRGAVRVVGETPKARGERTRERVVDALVSLLGDGDPAPTAKSVAAQAGVSVRLVFHHFEDMESLYRMALAIQRERNWGATREVDPTLDLDERVGRTVAERAKLFDAIGPLQRAAAGLSFRRDDIAASLADADALAREWLRATFTPELNRAGKERRELLDALDAASSWEAWDRLRRVQRLSGAAARRTMARTLTALLAS